MPTILLDTSDATLWQRALQWVMRQSGERSPRVHWVVLASFPQARATAASLGWLNEATWSQLPFGSMAGLHRVESTVGSTLWCIGEEGRERELSAKADVIVTDRPERLPRLRRFSHGETQFLGLPAEALPPYLVAQEEGCAVFRRSAANEVTVPPQDVTLIGGGLAGAMVAYALSQRGVKTTLFDAGMTPGSGASALFAGLFHPHWQASDSPLFRLTRIGFRLMQPLIDEFPDCFIPCGVLDMASSETEYAEWERHYAANAPIAMPADFVQLLDAPAASDVAGAALPRGGWYFPRAGLVHAGRLVRRLLEAAQTRVLSNQEVKLRRSEQGWQICTPQGALLQETSTVVLCAAMGIPALLDLSREALGLSPLGGRISLLSHAPTGLGKVTALTGQGYFVKVGNAFAAIGATYEPEHQVWTSTDAHAHNMALLSGLFADEQCTGVIPAGFYQGVRAVCLDRLPLVGPGLTARSIEHCYFRGVPEVEKLPTEKGLWVCGAFGSRGLTWGMACADHVASLIMGEASVLDRSLAEALHPGRFLAARLVRKD